MIRADAGDSFRLEAGVFLTNRAALEHEEVERAAVMAAGLAFRDSYGPLARGSTAKINKNRDASGDLESVTLEVRDARGDVISLTVDIAL